MTFTPTPIGDISPKRIAVFWTKVVKTTDPNACWLWIGSTRMSKYRPQSSYGTFRLDSGRSTGAHRFSWALHNGAIPDGMEIMHECDNPKCVNPAHLKAGTHLENMRDRDSKHRRKPPVGEKSNLSKLTAEQVTEIRRLRKTGMLMREIGKLFNVTQVCVTLICTRQNWAHLPDPE